MVLFGGGHEELVSRHVEEGFSGHADEGLVDLVIQHEDEDDRHHGGVDTRSQDANDLRDELTRVAVDEPARAAERRRNIELRKIDAALARLDSGDYGWCVHCGEEIAAARLRLDPAVPVCIDCAQGAQGAPET